MADRITDLTGTGATPASGLSPYAQMLLGTNEYLPQASNLSPYAQMLLGPQAATPAPKAEAATAAPQISIPQEFVQGVKAGFPQVGIDLLATSGVVAKVFGYDQTATEILEFAQKNAEQLEQELPKTVAFEDVFSSPGNFARYALRTLGEGIPFIAATILGGGVGSIIGRLVGRGALTAAEGVAGLSRFGGAAGSVVTASAIETGGTANEVYGATKQIEPALAFSAGVAKGALEAVVPMAIARRFGFGEEVATGIIARASQLLDKMPTRLGRITAGAGMGIGVEGGTEMLQEAIDVAARSYVDENYEMLGPEAAMRILEAGFSGALLGGALGAVGGAVGGKPAAQETAMTSLPGGTPEPGAPKPTPMTAVPPATATVTPPGTPAPKVEPVAPGVVATGPDAGQIRTTTGGRLAPVADPNVSEFVAVSNPTESEMFLEFERSSAAQISSARAVGPREVYKISKAALATADTTVGMEDLPTTIDPNSIQMLPGMEGNKEQALALLQTAAFELSASNEELFGSAEKHAVIRQKATEFKESAYGNYLKAIELGARIRPAADQSFILVGGKRQGVPVIQDNEATFDTEEFDYTPTIAAGALPTPNTKRQSDVNVGRSRGEIVVNSFVPTKTDGFTDALRERRRFAVNEKKFIQEGGKVLEADFKEWKYQLSTALSAASVVPVTDTTNKTAQARAFVEKAQEENLFPRGVAVSDAAARTIYNEALALDKASTQNTATPKMVLLAQRGLVVRPLHSARGRIYVGQQKSLMNSLREMPTFPFWKQARAGVKVFGATLREIFERELLGKVTQSGKPLDLTDAKGGEVSFVYDRVHHNGDTQNGMRTIPERADLDKVVNIFRQLMKEFGLTDTHLVVVLGNTPGVSGSYFGATDAPVSFIRLNEILFGPGRLNAKNVNTMVHEFGHMLTHRRYYNAAPSTQLKIYSAYHRAMIKASMGTVRNVAEMQSLFRAQGIFAGIPPTMSTLEYFAGDATGNYHLSFDEYFAEQVARHVLTNAKALTKIERFFRGIARDLRRLYTRFETLFGLPFQSFKAEKHMAAWLEHLKAEAAASPKFGTPLALTMNNSLVTSWNENAEALPPGTPDGEITEKIIQLFEFADIPKEQARVLRAGVGRINWLMKWFFTIRQLSVVNPSIKGLRLYNELIDRWALTKAQVQTRADATIKEWRGLSQKSQDALAKFIFHVEKMEYLKENEPARLPTNDELLALAKRFGITNEAFEVYQRMRGDLLAFLDKMEAIAIRDVNETLSNPLIAEVKAAEIRKEFAGLRARPYFPHSRFGDYTVVVKEKKERGKTLYMEQFATKKEAEEAFTDISKQFPNAAVRVDMIPEEAKPFRGLPPTLLSQIRKLPGLTEQQQQWLEQLTLELAPTQSFRKRLIRRENVGGYSLEAMRSYANYMWHGANYLARVEYQRPLQEAVNSVHAEASDVMRTDGIDVTKLRKIADFMQNHLDQVLNPAPDWAQLRSLAFTWWLGFSPVAAFTNLTQNVVTTYPYLASRFGDLAAVNAMRKATMDMQRIARGKTEFISDAQMRATQRAVEKGITDESFAQELAATAEGYNLTGLLPGNKTHRMQMMFAHYSAWMYQQAEKVNRRIAFAAGWRLAMENPNAQLLKDLKEQNQLEYNSLVQEGFPENEALAYLTARDAVWTTQFQYSAAARPRFLRGKKGVLFAFFSFVQNSLFFATHDKGRIRFLLMMLLIGGIMGLPGAEDINALVRFLSRRLLGEDVDMQKELREFIVDVAGNSVAPDLILHGTSRVGFGIHHAADLLGFPAPMFDVSGNVGMGSIIPGVTELGPPGKSFDATFERVAESTAGAVFGIGFNAIKAMGDDELPMFDGKRWERAMPRAVKSLAKAYRYAEEGRERTRSGATLLKFDASDPDHLAEIVGQALGFTPTRMTRVWDRQRMETESIAFWSIRRQMLLRQFDHALASGDAPVVQDMVAAIRRYNNEVAIPGYGIASAELRASVKERQRRRRLIEAGLPATRRDIPLSRDVKRLFPETNGQVIDAEPAPK